MPRSFGPLACLVVAALALAGPSACQSPSAETTPRAPSAAATPIERFLAQVDADRRELGIPGLSIAVIQGGEPTWLGGLGLADVEARIPATEDTLYHVASVTKTFTAILALRLVEQGRLDLEAPVSRFVPDVDDDRVRIKHLLSHTAGGTPGERYSYDPDRFEHLKAVLEAVDGRPLRVQFVETFLDPLGMHDSVPGPNVVDDPQAAAGIDAAHLARYRQVMSRFAEPYTLYGDREVLQAGYPPDDFWASAGLLSTVRDLARYDIAVDRGALLGEAMRARAWAPFMSNAGKPLAHGLGWFATDYRGTRLVWHYGHWGTGFSALYLKVPADRLTLIILANSEALADHHFKVGQDVTHNLFACAFLQAFVPRLAQPPATGGDVPTDSESTAPSTDCAHSSRIARARWLAERRARARASVPVASDVLAPLAGRYRFEHRTVTVTHADGRLYIDVPEDGRSELFAESPTRFFLKIRPWTLTFVEADGRIVRLDVEDGGQIVSAVRVE